MGKKKAEQDSASCVCRGGGWSDPPAFARVAYRTWLDPLTRYNGLGVRLVRHRSALERLAESLRRVGDEQEG